MDNDTALALDRIIKIKNYIDRLNAQSVGIFEYIKAIKLSLHIVVQFEFIQKVKCNKNQKPKCSNW